MNYKSILDTIGNTPVFKVQNISINNTNLYVKAEYFNPASSVKDRLAISIIENAENKGLLEPGNTVVEVTQRGKAVLGVCLRKLCPQDSFCYAFREKKTVRKSTPGGCKTGP